MPAPIAPRSAHTIELLAIHVRTFADPVHPAWRPVRAALIPGGRFAVSFQPLDPGDAARLADRFTEAFSVNGLIDIRRDLSNPGEGPVVVVIGAVPS